MRGKPPQHLNPHFFVKHGASLPPQLLADILRGLTKGFPTRYRGGGDFMRNYTREPRGEEEKQKEKEKAREMVQRGWGAGPFSSPPTPNAQCPKQPILTLSIPKHKWADDGSLRLIFHKSFPKGLSINTLTPRHDIRTYFPKGKYQYFSFAVLIGLIARIGMDCLLTQFDAKDAYKQLYIWVGDLNQQIFEVDGLFFVDWCAVFGSLYGNDIYSAFGNAHCMCLAAMADPLSSSLRR